MKMGQQTSSHFTPNTVDDSSQISQKPNNHRRRFFNFFKATLKTCRTGQSEPKRHTKAKRKCVSKSATLEATTTVIGNPCLMKTFSAQDRKRKHSLTSFALSKLAFFSKRSLDKLHQTRNGVNETEKITLHTRANSVESKSNSHQSEDVITASANNSSQPCDENNNSVVMKEDPVKELIPTRGINDGESSADERYQENLKRFEKLLSSAMADLSTDESSTSCIVDENNNLMTKKQMEDSLKPLLSGSQNPTEVSAFLVKWLTDNKMLSSCTSCTSSKRKKGRTKQALSRRGRGNIRNNARSGPSRSTSSKSSKWKWNFLSSKKRSPSAKSKRQGKKGIKSKDPRKYSCGGKGCFRTAPPVYLDYGCLGGSAGRASKDKGIGIERLKNVDVVEELTYTVPNPNGTGEGDCGEDCDYYAVCESCGEMEPISDELKKQFMANGRECDSTPVTYSRRQRFNFKNKGDLDDDGPPYPYEGLQCPSCRCPCCVAGLRRSPHCCCKCCQTMGNARRCNSFDEFPVGKNPQIRRILCPEEECKNAQDQCDKLMPEQSGLYKYEKVDRTFEAQVPRTPTPIILEVPKPRPLGKDELEGITTHVLKNAPMKDPEPIYLPPMFGECNPRYPPCCAPTQIQCKTADTASDA